MKTWLQPTWSRKVTPLWSAIGSQDGVISTSLLVEVKTRKNSVFGAPEEAIDFHKLQNLQQAINHYVKYKHIRQPIRFDIVSIVGTIGQTPDIRHIQDVTLI